MDIKLNYLINGKTVLFYGVLVENGELFTFVMDGEEVFLVPMSPVQLIDHSLMSYGSTFKGALKSSKNQLSENKCMYPIKIDALLDIWLFPTKSYRRVDCVWFNLKHIKNTRALGNKFTQVFMDYGHTFELIMRESAFRDKRQTAQDLKDTVTQNSKNSLNGSFDEPVKGFMIVEKKGVYTCKSRGKEDQ